MILLFEFVAAINDEGGVWSEEEAVKEFGCVILVLSVVAIMEVVGRGFIRLLQPMSTSDLTSSVILNFVLFIKFISML